MNHHQSPTNDREQAAWQADRFLLDDLSPAEQAEYAELLATDQATRERLAEEAGLMACLAQLSADDFTPAHLVTPASTMPEALERRASPRSGTWLASGALAASLLLMVAAASQFAWFGVGMSGTSVAVHDRQMEELAGLWLETQADDDSPTLAVPHGHELLLGNEVEAAEGEIAPDWMFAAVAAESAASSAGTSEPEDMQWQ